MYTNVSSSSKNVFRKIIIVFVLIMKYCDKKLHCCELEDPRVFSRYGGLGWISRAYTVTFGLPLPSLQVSCLSRPCLPGDGNEKWQHADSSRALEWEPSSLYPPPPPPPPPPQGTPGRDQWNIESPLSLRHFNNRRLQYPTCR